MRLDVVRQKYPKFIYKNYSYKIEAGNLKISFLFEIPPDIIFRPQIIIEAGYLNAEQIAWWKNLIINGMGQFFYENKIDWRTPNFLQIRNLPTPDVGKFYRHRESVKLRDRYLVLFVDNQRSL